MSNIFSRIVVAHNSLQTEDPPKWISVYPYNENEIGDELSSYSENVALPYQGAVHVIPNSTKVLLSGLSHSSDSGDPLVVGNDSVYLFDLDLDTGVLTLLDSFSPVEGEYAGSVNSNVSRSGNYIGVTSNIGLHILKVENNQLVEVETISNGSFLQKCEFSRNDRYLIFGSINGGSQDNAFVYLFEDDYIKSVGSLRIGHGSSFLRSMRFNHDDTKIITANFSNSDGNASHLCSFNKITGEIVELDSIETTGYAWDAVFTPDGNYAIIISRASPHLRVVEVLEDSFGEVTHIQALNNRAMWISIDDDNNVFISIRAQTVSLHYFKFDPSNGTLTEIDTGPSLEGGPHAYSNDVVRKPEFSIEVDEFIELLSNNRLSFYTYSDNTDNTTDGTALNRDVEGRCLYLHKKNDLEEEPIRSCDYDEINLEDYVIYAYIDSSTRPIRIPAEYLTAYL